jgi:EpsI family protein
MTASARNVALGLLMVISAGAAYMSKPSKKLADLNPPITLEAIVPVQFGDWREQVATQSQIVNPQQQLVLDEIYSQTLSKTFVNANGYRIMLSIAYGGDQSRDLQVHRPEVCYSVQGFAISGMQKVQIPLGDGSLPVMRLQTMLGARAEPVTYWVRIGDKIVRGNIEQGLARLSYGIQGYIADGLLFRVSSIDQDTSTAYKTQGQFVDDLMRAIPTNDKAAFLGTAIPRW